MHKGQSPRSLTAYQRAIWLAQIASPDSRAFYATVPIRISGRVQAPALAEAFRTFCAHHDALRLRFGELNGSPVQWLEDEPACETVYRDCAGDPTGIDAIVATELARSYDLSVSNARLVHVACSDTEHLVFLCNHHLAFDLVSTDRMLLDMPRLYDALSSGTPVPQLPRTRYLEFSDELERRGPAAWRDAVAWARRVLHAPPSLELTPTQPSAGEARSMPMSWTFQLPARAVALVRQAKLNSFRTLMAAYVALLSAYTRSDEFVVGTPADVRPRPRFADTVGDFVNLLPIRVRVKGSDSFADLAARVNLAMDEALVHRSYPFIEMLGQASAVSGPVVQTSFSLNRLPTVRSMSAFMLRSTPWRATFLGEPASAYPVAQQEGHYAFSMWMAPVGDSLWGEIKYDASHYDEAFIDQIATAFGHLIERALEQPDRPLCDLDSPGAERIRKFTRSGGLAAERPPLVVDRVLEQARERADEPAVVDASGSHTYADLARVSASVARTLSARGVEPGDAIAVACASGFSVIACQLGIWRVGAHFVSIDRSVPVERRSWIVEDAGARLLIVDDESSAGGAVLALGSIAAAAADGELTCALSRCSRAYVIYTSGSTGRPKGVIISHGSLSEMCANKIQTFSLDAKARTSHLASLGFDASVFEIWPTLAAGGRVHVVPESIRADVSGILAYLAEERVTHAFLPTPIGESLLTTATIPRTLASIAIAGDTLRIRPPPGFGPAVYNLYGPTEATVWTTSERVSTSENGRPTIGRPIPGVEVRILDAALRPVPVGVPGEIHIGGAIVAEGYVERSRMTAERFVPDPFRGGGTRMYRTGDRARWRQDGRIEFLGRNDNQVKVRGYRIELDEVEAALMAIEGVAAGAVSAPFDPSGARTLVGYYVRANASIDEPYVERELARHLPDFMIPRQWVAMESLPLTSAGKIDRRRLPAPKAVARGVAPEGDHEVAIARAMAAELRVDAFGATDDFFAFGGHSLAAARVIVELRRTGIRLSLPEFIRLRTPRALAAVSRRPAPQSPRVLARSRPHANDHASQHRFVVLVDAYSMQLKSVLTSALASEPWLVVDVPVDAGVDVGFLTELIARETAEAHAVLVAWSALGPLAACVADRMTREGGVGASAVLLDSMTPELLRTTLDRASPAAWLGRERSARGELSGRLPASLDELARALSSPGHAVEGGALEAEFENLRDRAERLPQLPNRLTCAIVLARAKDRSADPMELPHDLGWTLVCDELHVLEADGNHFTMLRVGRAEDIVDRLRPILRAVGGTD